MQHRKAEPMTVEKLTREFQVACKLAGFNPAKDTLAATVERFNERDLRHLLLSIDGGGMLCICADPEMSRKIVAAIDKINADYEDNPPKGCAMLPFPDKDAPQEAFNNFFGNLENAIGGN